MTADTAMTTYNSARSALRSVRRHQGRGPVEVSAMLFPSVILGWLNEAPDGKGREGARDFTLAARGGRSIPPRGTNSRPRGVLDDLAMNVVKNAAVHVRQGVDDAWHYRSRPTFCTFRDIMHVMRPG